METVQQLLDEKGHEVWSVHPDDSVFDAIKKMADKEIGSLVVLEGDKIVGIITERRYARNVILKGKSSLETPVRNIMETRVVCARTDQTIEECMAVMTNKRIRHLPVVDQNGWLVWSRLAIWSRALLLIKSSRLNSLHTTSKGNQGTMNTVCRCRSC